MNSRKLVFNVMRASGLAGVLALLISSAGVHANGLQGVQASSLQVKARIASMEQVNVTAEKPLDETVPAPSAAVADLLAHLEELDATAEVKDNVAAKADD